MYIKKVMISLCCFFLSFFPSSPVVFLRYIIAKKNNMKIPAKLHTCVIVDERTPEHDLEEKNMVLLTAISNICKFSRTMKKKKIFRFWYTLN
jgi:hypothetical protein